MKDKNAEKQRLDALLFELGLYPSREKAAAHVLGGDVTVDGNVCTRAGTRVRRDAVIGVKSADKYVSRGGEKLEGALDAFHLEVSGTFALDVGASTGGFTDCMLQRGATHVTAVDVGYGQIAVCLRDDPRVTVIERTNARFIQPEQYARKFDLITIDVSFISLEKVLPALAPLLSDGGAIVALVKPQFEAGPNKVSRGGVIREPEVHVEVLINVSAAAFKLGLAPVSAIFSPLTGPAGNIEFFMLLRGGSESKQPENVLTVEILRDIVARAHINFAK